MRAIENLCPPFSLGPFEKMESGFSSLGVSKKKKNLSLELRLEMHGDVGKGGRETNLY